MVLTNLTLNLYCKCWLDVFFHIGNMLNEITEIQFQWWMFFFLDFLFSMMNVTRCRLTTESISFVELLADASIPILWSVDDAFGVLVTVALSLTQILKNKFDNYEKIFYTCHCKVKVIGQRYTFSVKNTFSFFKKMIKVNKNLICSNF